MAEMLAASRERATSRETASAPPKWVLGLFSGGARPRMLLAVARSLLVIVDVVVKVAVVGLAVYPLLDPGSSHFAGKAMGIRAAVYPLSTVLIPVFWWASGRPRPYPFLADIAICLPFAVDAAANVFGLFAIKGFDALPHAAGWFLLCLAFGLAVAPLVDRRLIAFLLVVGFGASIDVLWELGEYLLMRSGSSGLQLTYENTIQDLAVSFLGGVLAGVGIVTVLWPPPGTPRSPFGWAAETRVA